jgi:hypothetical protein
VQSVSFFLNHSKKREREIEREIASERLSFSPNSSFALETLRKIKWKTKKKVQRNEQAIERKE